MGGIGDKFLSYPLQFSEVGDIVEDGDRTLIFSVHRQGHRMEDQISFSGPRPQEDLLFLRFSPLKDPLDRLMDHLISDTFQKGPSQGGISEAEDGLEGRIGEEDLTLCIGDKDPFHHPLENRLELILFSLDRRKLSLKAYGHGINGLGNGPQFILSHGEETLRKIPLNDMVSDVGQLFKRAAKRV